MSHERRLSFSRKTIAISSIVSVLAVGSFVTGRIIIQHNANIASQNDAKKHVEDTGFQTLLPKGKSITELGGWERISPDGADPVFAYADKIAGVSISVSEQPLPDSFQQDVSGKVAELAKKFNATTIIDAGEVKAYLGTSAKGPQSVIFTEDDLLVLMKSQKNISEAAWKSYIQSLLSVINAKF